MGEQHLISRKKALYPVSDFFRTYLSRYGRIWSDSIRYNDLSRFTTSVPVYDEKGNDTLWSTVLYSEVEREEIHEKLLNAYAILKADGDTSITEYLYIDRVDQCNHGNTLPFRVRVVNRINENFDYFYVKKIDANRIYGLELDHILSPNRVNYFIHKQTIVEEHVIGIPADAFLRENLPITDFDRVRLAKEFVKFNERCSSPSWETCIQATSWSSSRETSSSGTSGSIRSISINRVTTGAKRFICRNSSTRTSPFCS